MERTGINDREKDMVELIDRLLGALEVNLRAFWRKGKRGGGYSRRLPG